MTHLVKTLALLFLLTTLVLAQRDRNRNRNRNRDRNSDRNRDKGPEYRIWDASYGNLTCFSCSLDFRFRKFDVRDPCLGLFSPVNKTNLVRCGANEMFCKEDFLVGNGVLWTVHRQCTAICYAGCRPRGFGITHTTCTRCCGKHGCNGSPPAQMVDKAAGGHGNTAIVLFNSFMLMAARLTNL